MSTTEPFMPHPGGQDGGVPAADIGPGGPEPAAGFGVAGEEPDRVAGDEPTGSVEDSAGTPGPRDTPFRTPDPRELHDS
jgi:hypothetical protein